jgi:glycosidase
MNIGVTSTKSPTIDRVKRHGTYSHIYWKSHAPDTNGDGIGDCNGLIQILPLLKSLGFRGAWIAPFWKSGGVDGGYDVVDYYDIDPTFGTMHDVRNLTAVAKKLGLELWLDLVPCHTSDKFPQFQEALRDSNSRYRNWYIFQKSQRPGRPPTDTCSVFGDIAGSAWTYNKETDDWYFHLFYPGQPALRGDNPEVQAFQAGVLEFWADMGFSGARIDSARVTVLHPEIGTISEELLYPDDPYPWNRWEHSKTCNVRDSEGNNLSALAIKKLIATVRERHPNFYAVAENVGESRQSQEEWAQVANVDVLDYGFTGPDVGIGFVPPDARSISESLERLAHYSAQGIGFVPFNSNHDDFPFSVTNPQWVTDPMNPDTNALKALMTLLLTSPTDGPVILYGIPMGAGLGVDMGRDAAGRDRMRQPIRFDESPNGGFTSPHISPYLPLNPDRSLNVKTQLGDPDSVLNFTKAAIALREEIGAAPVFRLLQSPDGVAAYQLGRYRIAINVEGRDVDLKSAIGPTESVLSEQSAAGGNRLLIAEVNVAANNLELGVDRSNELGC